MANIEEPKAGYLIDYISGQPVPDKPEERQAVQVFAKILVEDYGYPKSHIQTHPQWRVKVRPSDTKKEYPVDIAVVFGSMVTSVCFCGNLKKTGRSSLRKFRIYQDLENV